MIHHRISWERPEYVQPTGSTNTANQVSRLPSSKITTHSQAYDSKNQDYILPNLGHPPECHPPQSHTNSHSTIYIYPRTGTELSSSSILINARYKTKRESHSSSSNSTMSVTDAIEPRIYLHPRERYNSPAPRIRVSQDPRDSSHLSLIASKRCTMGPARIFRTESTKKDGKGWPFCFCCSHFKFHTSRASTLFRARHIVTRPPVLPGTRRSGAKVGLRVRERIL